MAARLVQVTLINNSDFPIRWLDDGRPHGFWQDPWFPSNIKDLKKGERGTWRLESGGIATGVEGWALFMIDVPFASNVGVRTEFFRLWWERPYIGHFAKDITHTLQDPRTNNSPHSAPALTYINDHGFTDIANMDSSPFEFILAIPGAPLTAPIFLNNDANAKHVAWLVEVLNTGISSSLPLRVAPQSVIYAIADNGDLLWFRHEGRDDGSFRWTDNNARKVGVGWNMKQVFSGGDGVIYAINDNGDLLWFRHEGRNDGSFRWTDNNPRKVGVGWNMKQVFSGGDGVIYAINDNGDLLWFRHEGRDDGSFRWTDNNARKVGIGWNMKQVFSGGDGVIYAINDNGDLLWFRHEGRDDGSFRWTDNNARKVGVGWNMNQVFSGGEGVIYAINDNGDLLWFRHEGRNDGSFRWTDNNARKVGVGWNMKQVFPG